MLGLSERNFWRAALSGLAATYVMTAMGFWQAALKFLPKMDVGAMLAMNSGHSWVWGNTMHFVNGVILALIFARWFYSKLPGGWFGRGIIYGIILYIVAALVVVPLASPAGFFFSKAKQPFNMNLGALVIHLAYGLALALAYRPEGEETG